MSETMEITVYKFNELSDKAKQKAIEDYARDGMNWEWWDTVYADAKEDGKKYGLDIDDIRFSGFWSQGDGASWTGRVNLHTFIETSIPDTHPLFTRAQVYAYLIKDGWIDEWLEISRQSYHYAHSGTMRTGEVDDGALINLQYDFLDEGDQLLACDCPLKGASVRELALGINAEDFARELMDAVLEKATAFADKIYEDLEKMYDWYISEECVADHADTNKWRFDADGNLI